MTEEMNPTAPKPGKRFWERGCIPRSFHAVQIFFGYFSPNILNAIRKFTASTKPNNANTKKADRFFFSTTQIEHKLLRIRTGGRLTSWLFTQRGPGVEHGTTENKSRHDKSLQTLPPVCSHPITARKQNVPNY